MVSQSVFYISHDTGENARRSLNPSQAGRHSIYLSQKDERLS